MVHKLEQEGVVDYLPYKGVALSSEGRRLANRTLRRRRLWELFLVEELGLGFAEADALACRMEHIGSDEVSERLAEYLGDPQTSSQGLPIPPALEMPVEPAGPLSRVAAGHSYELAFIGEPTLRQFLMAQSITEGSLIRVLATSSQGGVLIGMGEARLEITAEAAAQLYVRRSILKENNAICAIK
jgi:DtxR family Mn-dependent transcriptional regulator